MGLIADPEVLSLVACDRLGLVGFAVMQFGDDRAHLLLLAVHPRCQRQGVARRLMQWLFASARVAGMAELSLELRAGNAAARAFYRALGFADAGLVSGYYRNRESAIRMMRVLRSRRSNPRPGSRRRCAGPELSCGHRRVEAQASSTAAPSKRPARRSARAWLACASG